MVGTESHLTAASAELLVGLCPRLRWLGDLRDWEMSQGERAELRRRMRDQGGQQGGWEMRRSEPSR